MKLRRGDAILKDVSAAAEQDRATNNQEGGKPLGFSGYIKRKYLTLCVKIVRETATPEYIARGWAIGMFYGCAIPFGFQLVLSLPTAFLLRGSKIGASIGTLITNHFTIFLIYPVQCIVGNRLIGGRLSYPQIKEAMNALVNEQSYGKLFSMGGELVASFFIGGALLAAVMTPLTYYAVKSLVVRRRLRKERRACRQPEE